MRIGRSSSRPRSSVINKRTEFVPMSTAASVSLPEASVGTGSVWRHRRVVSPAMATKPPKRKVKGGRVTPKGGPVSAARAPASSRYTPPIPREYKVSPTWVPVLMFTLLAIGLVVIFCNYIGVLPGGTKNSYLLLGLGSILGGIITATQYR